MTRTQMMMRRVDGTDITTSMPEAAASTIYLVSTHAVAATTPALPTATGAEDVIMLGWLIWLLKITVVQHHIPQSLTRTVSLLEGTMRAGRAAAHHR
jgi:hypothetical protein